MKSAEEIMMILEDHLLDQRQLMFEACEHLSDLDEDDSMVVVYSKRYDTAFERHRELRSVLRDILADDVE